MAGRSFTFTHAIVRTPSAAMVRGLRAEDHGDPDFSTFCQHHTDYVAVLEATGATVVTLPALDAYPDSVFVEDAALCLPEGAVVMRPGAPTRLGEAAEMAPTLRELYDTVAEIKAPGFIEGGDILVTEREILVGTSERTNAEGIAALAEIVEPWGHAVRTVQTPPGVLHFKTDCSLLAAETILATERLAASGCFEGYEIIHTCDGEEAAANSIRFNDVVVMPEGFPETAARVRDAGYSVKTIGNSEAAKLDGGMSCLSLRFTRSGLAPHLSVVQ
ncbi:MAG: arginine deiminase family protein [Pseudomonadota bacterium]